MTNPEGSSSSYTKGAQTSAEGSQLNLRAGAAVCKNEAVGTGPFAKMDMGPVQNRGLNQGGMGVGILTYVTLQPPCPFCVTYMLQLWPLTIRRRW